MNVRTKACDNRVLHFCVVGIVAAVYSDLCAVCTNIGAFGFFCQFIITAAYEYGFTRGTGPIIASIELIAEK